jgi:hypothetical protein
MGFQAGGVAGFNPNQQKTRKAWDAYRKAFASFQIRNPHNGPALSYEDWLASQYNPFRPMNVTAR